MLRTILREQLSRALDQLTGSRQEAQRKAFVDLWEQQWDAKRKALVDLVEQQWDAQKKAFEEALKAIGGMFKRKPE
jgi:hypothetical protein